MENEQVKDQVFPCNRTDLQQPIFSWMKTIMIGDDFIIWWLFYGNALGRKTLCHRLFHPKNKPLDYHKRMALSWNLRLVKQRLRREWRERYPNTCA